MERILKDLTDSELTERRYSLLTMIALTIGESGEEVDAINRLMNQVNYEIMCRAEEQHGKRHAIMRLKKHFGSKIVEQ